MIRNTDQPEQFAPLGAPIRPAAPTPAPKPEPIGNGLFRKPDGTLETRIPPPAISPAQRQGMWQRDTQRMTMAEVNATQAADWLTITKQVQDLPNR
jgi:hypothetical protein